MSDFRSTREASRPSPGGPAEAAEADLSSVLIYPRLEELFAGEDSRALTAMRSRLSATHRELERVVRLGTREDAERATRAARAYQLVSSLLDELEGLGRGK